MLWTFVAMWKHIIHFQHEWDRRKQVNISILMLFTERRFFFHEMIKTIQLWPINMNFIDIFSFLKFGFDSKKFQLHIFFEMVYYFAIIISLNHQKITKKKNTWYNFLISVFYSLSLSFIFYLTLIFVDFLTLLLFIFTN